MDIRVMDIADYDQVYALWMSCKNMGFNNLDDSREEIARFLKRNQKFYVILISLHPVQ